MTPNLRRSVRAIILDEDDRILLCRFDFPHPAVPEQTKAVWAAPGGGIEPGEDPLTALRRELREETGLAITADPPHVWRQEVVAAHHVPGFDGIINDYFLIRATHFSPRRVDRRPTRCGEPGRVPVVAACRDRRLHGT